MKAGKLFAVCGREREGPWVGTSSKLALPLTEWRENNLWRRQKIYFHQNNIFSLNNMELKPKGQVRYIKL